MHKDFDGWNKSKKSLDNSHAAGVFFREREVWWCALGVNIGHEAMGTGAGFSRPVVIMKKFNQHTALVLPLTTSSKESVYLISLPNVGSEHTKANLSQARLIDARRFLRKHDVVPKYLFALLQQRLCEIYFGNEYASPKGGEPEGHK